MTLTEKDNIMKATMMHARKGYSYFVSGVWFVSIVRQIVLTGGNIAESAFLIATLWVIINAVAHTLLTWFMPLQMIELFNYLAVISFSALPELIIIPVIITCFTHWSSAVKHRDKTAMIWGTLYSIPTAFFLVMTILAITTFVSTGGSHFVPADGMQLVIRCLSGWMYAVVNMLFDHLGKPHYDSIIGGLNRELTMLKDKFNLEITELKNRHTSVIDGLNESLTSEIAEVKSENAKLKTNLDAQLKLALSAGLNAADTGVEPLYQMYPSIEKEWIMTNKKSVSLDEIIKVTGINKRRVTNARIRKTGRNDALYFVSSVLDWLNSQIKEDTNQHYLRVVEG